MSKIQNVLSEITAFLEGPDHSNSVRFRSLAGEYAAICEDVAHDLAECRDLVDKGLAMQALQANNRCSPALSERARMLMFPGQSKWIELCVMYNAAVPPLFDLSLVEKLESGEFEKVVDSTADLQTKWRILARTGTNHEKIVLLRKLVKYDRTAKVWQKNLETVERAWIIELQAEARKAQALGDMPHLYALYSAMTSPELCSRVPQSVLDPFLDDIHQYQKKLIAEKQTSVLNRIAESYDKKDAEVLQNLLTEWNTLTKDPLFCEDPDAASQVKEAKGFLSHLMEQQDARMRANDLQLQLQTQLDDRLDFPEIEKTYHDLKQINADSIDPVLEERYQSYGENYRTEQKRRHARTICRWLIFSLFAAAGIVFAVIKVQQYLQTEEICAEMQDLIRNGAPEQALQYFETLSREKPDAASREAVLSVREEAQREKNSREKDRNAYETLLARTAEYLSEEKVELEPLEIYMKKTEEFTGYHTKEQTNRFMQQKEKRLILLRILQEKRDAKFQDDMKKQLDLCFKLDTRLENQDTVKTSEVESELFKISQEVAILTGNSSRISAELLEQGKKDFELVKKQLGEKIKKVSAYQLVVKQLTRPDSLSEYLTGLQDAPLKAPQKYAAFRAASDQVVLIRKIQHIEENFPPKTDAESKKIHDEILTENDPFCCDIRFILPQPDALASIRKNLESFRNELPKWKLYEVVIPYEGQKLYWYFQDRDCLEVERAGGRIGGAYRSITAKMQKNMQQTVTVTFTVARAVGTDSYDLTGKKCVESFPELPGKITGITPKQMALFAKKEIPLAPHYALLKATLDRLGKISSISEMDHALFEEILEYGRRKDINPAAGMEILSRLLEQYRKISDYHAAYVQKIFEAVGTLKTNTCWISPDVEMKESYTLKKFDSFFTSDEWEKIRKKADLTKQAFRNSYQQSPLPAGVLYVGDAQITVHFFRDRIRSEEYFVSLPYQNRRGYFILPHELLETGKMEIAKLPPCFSQIQNGDIFYAPRSLQNMKKQILPESSFPMEKRSDLFRIPAVFPVE